MYIYIFEISNHVKLKFTISSISINHGSQMLIKSNDIINNANLSFIMACWLSTQRAWDGSYDSHKSQFGSFCGQQCWCLSYMTSCITTFISIITQSHIHIMDSFKVSVGFVCIWCRLLTADVADSLLSYFTNTFLHKFLVHVCVMYECVRNRPDS